MATTTNYGWTTPDDTALVKDGAAAIRTLGTSVDTTTKNLNPSTTLGDIEYRSSTANTNTRLGIGSTGNVLTVAGGVPTWAAPAGGASPALIQIVPTSTTVSGGSATIGGTGAITFSGCTSMSVNGAFTSTYTNYLIITDSISANTQTDISFRLRASGSDTTSNYKGIVFTKPFTSGVSAPVSIGTTTFGTSNIYFGDGNSTANFSNNFVISSPNVASKTSLTGAVISEDTYFTVGGYQTDSTQFDGFTFYTTTNNITGVVRIYGYSK
jgi:hypothetical protein